MNKKPGNRQKDTNPFPYSDSNKRYYTYDYWLKKTFGGKCARIPLDAGFSCPNIDGRCSVGGCIYCSTRGSGDFAGDAALPIAVQYERERRRLSAKWSTERTIPYFQAHTNTYAPLSVLQEKFDEALRFDGAVGLAIATRADCLPDDIVRYLGGLADKTVLCVDLGLQTASDRTAALINRGHTFADFCDGYRKLRDISDKIQVCVHIIFGLPGETEADMLDTVRAVAALKPDQIKIHLLHVLRGTVLAGMYLRGEYQPMKREDYIRTVGEALMLLPPDTVICRLTGDGKGSDLLAPDWSRDKRSVLNDIDKWLYTQDAWQGKNYDG